MSAAMIAVREALHKYGEPVELTVRETGITHYLRASVQSQVENALVNDLDQTGFIVYIAASDLSKAPVKFDRIKIRGIVTGLEEDARLETLEGVNIAYMVRTSG